MIHPLAFPDSMGGGGSTVVGKQRSTECCRERNTRSGGGVLDSTHGLVSHGDLGSQQGHFGVFSLGLVYKGLQWPGSRRFCQ